MSDLKPSDLKLCPFCKCEMKLDHELARYGDRVFHPDNGCAAMPFAVEPFVWNERPVEDTLSAEIAALERNKAVLNSEIDSLAGSVNFLAAELTAARAEIERLIVENGAMYAAILEASSLGQSASLRCKVELQRIARNDATCPPSLASAPESAPTGAERQTDRPGEADGAGEGL